MKEKQLLTQDKIEAAEKVLVKGDRVELIPVKDGVKVIKVKRVASKLKFGFIEPFDIDFLDKNI